MSLPESSQLSVRDYWARHHINKALIKRYNKYEAPQKGIRPLEDHEELPEPPKLRMPEIPSSDSAPSVCIIGAGAAGLFTALLFDYLNKNVNGFNVQYDIFESQENVGGRLYTYNFSDTPHDYYDVGAMRFPDNPIMARTFALFGYVGMNKTEPSDKTPVLPLGTVRPYFMQGTNEPWFFNGINHTGNYSDICASTKSADPFQLNADKSIPTNVLDVAAKSGPGTVLGYAIQPYTDLLKKNPEDGWKTLMKIDKMSTNYFLSIPPPIPNPTAPVMPPYDYDTIEWLETFGGGTNWYDQAHSETLLEYLDFDYAEDTKWWCIEGGAQQLAIQMRAKVSNQAIKYKSAITGIDVSTPGQCQIQLAGNWHGAYTGIFNSTTMGCLQQMDLSKAGLNYGQKQAIRSLGYGASAKVGMKFKYPWWIKTFGVTQGGLGHSDVPIRTTVYPSYNIYDSTDQTAVLLCSYEWQQDAQRISTLISSSTDHATAVSEEKQLKELVLRDLALLHAWQPGTEMSPEDVYALISDLYVDHYAHDWYHDTNTYGAFAFFRPQQFSAMWPDIIQSSPSFAMIGEHASNHHAWVVGALESAVNAVHSWLSQNNFAGAQEAARAMESWGPPTKTNPFGELPKWVSSTQREWQAIFGLLHHEKFLQEVKAGKHGAK